MARVRYTFNEPIVLGGEYKVPRPKGLPAVSDHQQIAAGLQSLAAAGMKIMEERDRQRLKRDELALAEYSAKLDEIALETTQRLSGTTDINEVKKIREDAFKRAQDLLQQPTEFGLKRFLTDAAKEAARKRYLTWQTSLKKATILRETAITRADTKARFENALDSAYNMLTVNLGPLTLDDELRLKGVIQTSVESGLLTPEQAERTFRVHAEAVERGRLERMMSMMSPEQQRNLSPADYQQSVEQVIESIDSMTYLPEEVKAEKVKQLRGWTATQQALFDAERNRANLEVRKQLAADVIEYLGNPDPDRREEMLAVIDDAEDTGVLDPDDAARWRVKVEHAADTYITMQSKAEQEGQETIEKSVLADLELDLIIHPEKRTEIIKTLLDLAENDQIATPAGKQRLISLIKEGRSFLQENQQDILRYGNQLIENAYNSGLLPYGYVKKKDRIETVKSAKDFRRKVRRNLDDVVDIMGLPTVIGLKHKLAEYIRTHPQATEDDIKRYLRDHGLASAVNILFYRTPMSQPE